MERKIKFRAKVRIPCPSGFFRTNQIPNGEWVYGEPHTIDGPCPHMHTGDVGKQPINPDTIEEFTGLYDKNGKEIYEGDVLKNNLSNKPFGVVTWHNAGYYFVDCSFGRFPISATGYTPLGEVLYMRLDGVKEVFFEVIGNIHDNPELLKGGEK